MHDPIEHIVAYPDLSTEEMSELQRVAASDRTIAGLLACRREIAASIREALSDPDGRLFSLFSLARAGRTLDLTAVEQAFVGEHSARLERDLARHPGLAIASADLAECAAEFSELWESYFESEVSVEETDAHRLAERHRSDRLRRAAERRPAGSSRRPGDRSAVSRSVLSRRPTSPRRRSAYRSAYRWVVRTGIAVAAVAFAFIMTQVLERESGMFTVETGVDETRFVELGDGSRIRVLESSTLSYADPQSAVSRRAELEGRAYFEIQPESRGFLIETPTARATVLGTAFGVEALDRITEVVLTEGRLTLARRTMLEDFVVLEAGQMSRVAGSGSPSLPISVDVPRRLTWTGLFIFQSTPLNDIAVLLSEHFAVAITVADDLAGERVTGTFDQDQSVEDILDVIASAVGAGVRSDGSGGYALTHP